MEGIREPDHVLARGRRIAAKGGVAAARAGVELGPAVHVVVTGPTTDLVVLRVAEQVVAAAAASDDVGSIAT